MALLSGQRSCPAISASRMIRVSRAARNNHVAAGGSDVGAGCWPGRQASSMRVQQGDRQVRGLDVCVVAQAGERDRGDAQLG